jgi:hypothetical protein
VHSAPAGQRETARSVLEELLRSDRQKINRVTSECAGEAVYCPPARAVSGNDQSEAELLDLCNGLVRSNPRLGTQEAGLRLTRRRESLETAPARGDRC